VIWTSRWATATFLKLDGMCLAHFFPSLEKLVSYIQARDYCGNRRSKTPCKFFTVVWCLLTCWNDVVYRFTSYGIEIPGIHFQCQNNAQWQQ
jgi:hypothetical protein